MSEGKEIGGVGGGHYRLALHAGPGTTTLMMQLMLCCGLAALTLTN